MSWTRFGLTVIPLVVKAANIVETLAAHLHGGDKETKAVNVARDLVSLTETLADRDVLNDAKVEQAVREFLRAYVALQNAIAAAQAARREAGR